MKQDIGGRTRQPAKKLDCWSIARYSKLSSNHTDAKLAAFAALVERLHGDEGRDRRVCVVTNYIATLYYLAAEIEGRRIRYHTFHGGMTLDTRGSALDSFCRGDSPPVVKDIAGQ